MFKHLITKWRFSPGRRQVLFLSHLNSYSTQNAAKILDDCIHIEKLNINTVVGNNLWNMNTKQRMQVSLHYKTDFSKSSDQDDLSNTLNYAVLSKGIMAHLESNSYNNIFQLNKNLVHYLESNHNKTDKPIAMKLDTTLLEAHLRSNSITVSYDSAKGNTIVVKNLRVLTYIGVFTFERQQKQFMDLELLLSLNDVAEDSGYDGVDVGKIVYAVVNFLENSNFKTVEALVNDTANVVFSQCEGSIISQAKVKVIKPQAILQCETGVGVSCVRSSEDFTAPMDHPDVQPQLSAFNLPIPTTDLPPPGSTFKVYLSIGTNQGDKLANIQSAIEHLKNIPGITKILKVSSIYKSKPMYYLDQSQFYNLALSLETTLAPIQLLKKLKEIEYDVLHRVKLFDNGPRPIDLDIIYYIHEGKHILVNDPTLIIPHKLMLERGFVLLPLSEILDGAMNGEDAIHPVSFEPVQNQLKQICDEGALGLERVTPLDAGKEISWGEGKTNVMSIANVTADSFSDGSVSPSAFVEKLNELEELGGFLVDVGGCSTNPKSLLQVNEIEEIQRISSVIDYIDREKFIVSLDSYRINVIEHFIGKIDIINDIGFAFFDKADRIAKLLVENPGKCYILNHTPGNSVKELKEIEKLKTSPDPKISEVVATDLLNKFNYLLSKGVNPSQIILDPGLGFGKAGEENFNLINNFKATWNSISLQFKDIPVLFGYSRKRFLNSKTRDLSPADKDLEGCMLLASISKQNNSMVRTHNLDFTNRALDVLKKLK